MCNATADNWIVHVIILVSSTVKSRDLDGKNAVGLLRAFSGKTAGIGIIYVA